jgi:hypothetical protein
VLGRLPRPTRAALSATGKTSKETVESKADAADRALVALISSMPKIPGRRTYVLKPIDGEWVFRRDEVELMVEEAFEEVGGPDPEADDDRRYETPIAASIDDTQSAQLASPHSPTPPSSRLELDRLFPLNHCSEVAGELFR